MNTCATQSFIDEKILFEVNSVEFPADILTPVSCYLKLRDQFPYSVLLESSDYKTSENSHSYICFDKLYSLKLKDNYVSISNNENILLEEKVTSEEVIKIMDEFINMFCFTTADHPGGVYGYTSFDAVKYFDTVKLQQEKIYEIPDMFYSFYRFILVIDHFTDKARLYEFRKEYEEPQSQRILNILNKSLPQVYSFSLNGEKEATTTEEEFLAMVGHAKEHCRKGDVFQLVLSRRFHQKYKGDDFMLYRALRSVSPSPYLFYFDFGNFRMMGASPETQLRIKNGKAEIHPIAGTFRRTGDDLADRSSAEDLINDPKENAEHIMLVDLARNDLNRKCKNVGVEKLAEVNFYSHVIHLVSKVTGELKNKHTASDLSAAVFPAGTLSGAPKIRAIELIAQYEKHARDFYGGAIGYFGPDNTCNHAITIRSAVAINGEIHYQAGAGIVVDSIPANELQEIYNKTQSINQALLIAQSLVP